MSTALAESAALERPTLRLFTEGKSSDGLSRSMRLSEFFERAFVPWLRGKLSSPDTITLYRESVAHWVRITSDPPLCSIDDDTCAGYVEGLARLPGRRAEFLASHTIARHCNQIQWILDRTGPRIAGDRKRRRNKNLLEEVPLIEKPALDVSPPDGDFTFDETLRILAAFSARPPRAPRRRDTGVDPATWWRALVGLLYYSGLRIGTAMRLEWKMLEGDYLMLPARIMKRRKGKKQFLHPEAREGIEPLRRGQALIFAYPNWIEKKGARRSMQRVFELRLIRANFPEHRQFGFHGFRKAHATELARMNPLAAQLSLGHSSSRTTSESYINHRVAEDSIQKLPSLRAAEKQRDTRQKRLFD